MGDNTLRHIIMSGPLLISFLEYASRGKMLRFIYSIINPVLWWLIVLMAWKSGYASQGGIQVEHYDVFPSIVENRGWVFFGFFVLINIIIILEYMLEFSNFFLCKLLSVMVFTPWMILVTSPLLFLTVNVFHSKAAAACLVLFWFAIFIWYMFIYKRGDARK